MNNYRTAGQFKFCHGLERKGCYHDFGKIKGAYAAERYKAACS